MCRRSKRLRIAEETMEIYAPLAGRMGMQGMREELEELAFRYINPGSLPDGDGAADRNLRAQSRRRRRNRSSRCRSCSTKRSIKAKVKSRQKKPWSVFRKMEAKALSLGAAVRPVRLPRRRRYGGGLLPRARRHPHDLVDGAGPVQGLHLDAEAERLPLDPYDHRRAVAPARRAADPHGRDEHRRRIRCCRACALQGRPQEGERRRPMPISKETNAYAWLRRTIEQLAEGDNPEDFLENTKLELFQDQVFCFTPKGMLIALPRGATPIDFAYAVHTEVGDTCVGAKINGRIMPLMTELKNGDEVEIIRSKAQVPPAAWESMVVTGKARAAIRRATKNAIRKQYSGLGRAHSGARLRPCRQGVRQGEAEAGAGAAGAQGCRGCADRRRPRRTGLRRRAAGRLPRLQGRARHHAAAQPREEGWSKIRNAAGMLFQHTRPGLAQGPQGTEGKWRGADPRRQRRSAGALRARWRGARRPHRRHHAAGRRNYHLSDPVAGADRFRRPAGALDRRALGHRRGQSRALSRAYLGDGDQCARLARRDRAGHRRQRRQHTYACRCCAPRPTSPRCRSTSKSGI